MTYREICSALRGEQMRKEASVKKLASIIGMKKKAAPVPQPPAATSGSMAPAGVGMTRPLGEGAIKPNQYQSTLIKNYGGMPSPDHYPYLPVTASGKANSPIQQGALQRYRSLQARHLNPFDEGTDQYTAADTYLQQRGAQNQQRFRAGTLQKNAPTNVKMPQNIPESQRAQLQRRGRLMVQNRNPSYSQQLYS